MDCLPKFPFCPQQSGYAAEFADGLVSTGVSGGPSYSRLDTTGNPSIVTASWVLRGRDYDLFMGHIRNWIRSGGDPFSIELALETTDPVEYRATFIPGSIRLIEKDGFKFVVSAQLEVLPNFVSPCSDEWASRAALNAFYGDDACEVMDILSKVVNEDLVYVRS